MDFLGYHAKRCRAYGELQESSRTAAKLEVRYNRRFIHLVGDAIPSRVF